MKTISFKVSDDEARQIRVEAKREQLSVSEFLRRRAIQKPTADSVTKVRCKQTGAEIFAGLTSAPPLTTQAVRELLADFP